MKKLLFMILFFFTFFSLAGCGLDTSPPDRFNLFDNAINNYTISSTNGFDYSSIQTVDEQVVNSDIIIQRVEQGTNLKAYTSIDTIRLMTFNQDDTQEVSNVILYYHNGQLGTKMNDGAITWEDYPLVDYTQSYMPIQTLSKSSLTDLVVVNKGTNLVLTAKVVDNSIAQFLGVENPNISDLQVEIILRLSDNRLLEITLQYSQSITQTKIVYKPYYEVVNVVIPTS